MGHLFMMIRLGAFALVFAGAGVVLGICANLAAHLLTTEIHDFLIFALVVSAFTIVVFVLLALRSQPRIDAVVLFILVALWLTMGAYSQDIIGYRSCYALEGQTIPARNGGTFSAENYCRQMKTVLAFSWANFVFLSAALIGLLVVVLMLYCRGERDIWKDSMSDVELFQPNKLPPQMIPPQIIPPPMVPAEPAVPVEPAPTSHTGSGSGSGRTLIYYPGSRNAPLQHQVIQQQPGHSVIIQNGQVTQVPGSVTSVQS